MSTATSLVESELQRKQLYTSFLEWFHECSGNRKFQDSSNMLLRYRFNLLAAAKDDPVFVTTTNGAAEAQFLKDCVYFRLRGKPATLLAKVQSRIAEAARSMLAADISPDAKVTMHGDYLHYKQLRFRDINELGKIDPVAAVALHIRYDYLHLDNHGLARVYEGGKDTAAEGFASAFNSYFSSYYSLFPDLEAPFGSRGNFFDAESFDAPIVQVNPPFDVCTCLNTVMFIFKLLEGGASNSFIMTFPNWQDFPALTELKTSPWTREIREYKKGELQFINHMTGKRIYPCGIVQVILSADKSMRTTI